MVAELRRTARRVRPYLRRSSAIRAVRGAALTGLDLVDVAFGHRDPLAPPRRLRGVGAGDFRAVGESLFAELVDPGGLTPEARVLDIGCGVGRLAIPIARYLTTGTYHGFDISPEMIGWCRRTLTPRYPNFQFTLLDVANSHYNPAGAVTADTAHFPYHDGDFDFALATSLFTHLLPSSFLNYALESARVLAPGGTLFGTFFLVDAETAGRIDRHESDLDLRQELHDPHTGTTFRALDSATPETAVGLDRDFVTTTLGEAGLSVSGVYPGVWSGRSEGRTYQDIVVARAPSA